MMMVGDSYARDFGPVFRVQDWYSDGIYNGDGYVCQVVTYGIGAYIVLLRVESGSTSTLASSSSFSFSGETFFLYEATADGDALTCDVYSSDGASKLATASATDDTYSWGAVGIWTYFDDYGAHYAEYISVDGEEESIPSPRPTATIA